MSKRRRRYQSISIDVSVDEILCDIDTEVLIEEVQSRKGYSSASLESDLLVDAENDLIRAAHDELLRNRPAAALALLARALFPKPAAAIEKQYHDWQGLKS